MNTEAAEALERNLVAAMRRYAHGGDEPDLADLLDVHRAMCAQHLTEWPHPRDGTPEAIAIDQFRLQVERLCSAGAHLEEITTAYDINPRPLIAAHLAQRHQPL